VKSAALAQRCTDFAEIIRIVADPPGQQGDGLADQLFAPEAVLFRHDFVAINDDRSRVLQLRDDEER